MSKKEKIARAMSQVLNDRDWVTFEAECPKCGKSHATSDTHKYCPYCGEEKGFNGNKSIIIDDLYAAFQAGKRIERESK